MLKLPQSTRFVVGVRRGHHVISLGPPRWRLEVGIVQRW